MEESKELGSHANQVDEIQTKSIEEFQKAYEVRLKTMQMLSNNFWFLQAKGL